MLGRAEGLGGGQRGRVPDPEPTSLGTPVAPRSAAATPRPAENGEQEGGSAPSHCGVGVGRGCRRPAAHPPTSRAARVPPSMAPRRPRLPPPGVRGPRACGTIR